MTPDRIQRSRAVVLMALMLTVPAYAADTKPLDNLLAQQTAGDKAAKGGAGARSTRWTTARRRC